MLSKHLKTPAITPKQFVERRRDILTREVVNGLQQLNAHMEQLPEGPQKAAALAAVACFAMRIAEALRRVNAEAGKTGESEG